MRGIISSSELDALKIQLEIATTNDDCRQIEDKISAYIKSRINQHSNGALLLGMWSVRIAIMDTIEKFHGHRILSSIDYEDLGSRLRLLENGFFLDVFQPAGLPIFYLPCCLTLACGGKKKIRF